MFGRNWSFQPDAMTSVYPIHSTVAVCTYLSSGKLNLRKARPRLACRHLTSGTWRTWLKPADRSSTRRSSEQRISPCSRACTLARRTVWLPRSCPASFPRAFCPGTSGHWSTPSQAPSGAICLYSNRPERSLSGLQKHREKEGDLLSVLLSIVISIWVSDEWPSSAILMLYFCWCNISGEAAGEIWNWSLLGVKAVTQKQRRLNLVLLICLICFDRQVWFWPS